LKLKEARIRQVPKLAWEKQRHSVRCLIHSLSVVLKEGSQKMRIFLESEEYWFEDFKVDNLTQAISELKTLYRNCKEAFKEDGVVRKIGVIIE
jgi:hypothetical protein